VQSNMKKTKKIIFIIGIIFIISLGFYLIQENTSPFWKTKSYPIIDAHMHMYQWNKYGDPPPPNLITGEVPAARSDSEAIDAYIGEMEKYNIVLAIGSGEREMVEKWKAHAPNKFLAGIEFPKYTQPVNQRVEEWLDPDELRELYENGELDIMGEITAQYAGVSLNDPKLDPYFALAEELDIPVQLHTGFEPPMSPYRGDSDFRMRHGNPLLLEDYLVKYPRVRVYIAHGGYPFIEETIALMLMYEQVYVDVSAINWLLTEEEFHYYLERLVQARLGKRIMYGSDQMIWPETVGMSIDAIESAPFLTKQQKQDIFFNNAATFFRLDKNKILETGIVDLDTKVVQVIRSPIELRPTTPGANKTVSVNLQLKGVKSTAIQVTGFDIDSLEEVVMTINDQEVKLPEEILADMGPRTVTIELEDGLLKEGENTINFLFAEAVGGTTGFSIHNLKILLRR